MKPIIGVTAQMQENLYDYQLQPVYISAILQEGGIPIVLPIVPPEEVEEVLDLVDGIVMTGGWDIDPNYYGEEPLPETGMLNFEMDEFDSTVVKQVIARDMPFFGTCRGMQMLNVVTGGTLYQSVLDQMDHPIKHKQDHGRKFPVHHVELVGGKILQPLFENGRTRVNSSHNQGVKTVGDGVTVAAKAPDGLVEAIELEDKRFILGTQWHPENFAVNGHEPSREIIAEFIRAAVEYRDTRG
ncbi:gamma-glutamyl-gamma-aminobutyrate hydrolase family protein [Edaphobacillus lindanitolerans]|uniref:Putative glutamine amidotransferase n=1 Tax=Edaphobacillus lindanitolerans TaxID=550447 RepID=A0A1U7PKF3_9BACI|nr:gamma-glutamyl-gamma-aminobutyrate hydrolase family protein [Edaphobacillus lindanitolerans]SIT66159.1 putative glutamine amidotransferase [Edaphobacillus lindanitolerans]